MQASPLNGSFDGCVAIARRVVDYIPGFNFHCRGRSEIEVILGAVHLGRMAMNDGPEPHVDEGERPLITFLKVAAVAIVVVGVLIGVPMFRNYGKVDFVTVLGNGGWIHMGLLEFEKDYGKFPDETTAARVKEVTGTTLDLEGSSSNAYFRQLIAAGMLPRENLFYANTAGSKKPDEDMTGARALEKGECGFTYVKGLSSKLNAGTPVAFTPMIPGTTRFDSEPFRNRGGVIVRLDGSSGQITIAADGKGMAGGGKDVLDPTNGMWKTSPVLAWPE